MTGNSSNYIKKKLKKASKSRKSRSNSQDDENSVFGKLLKSSVYGSLIGLIIGLLVLFISSLIAIKTKDPLKLTGILSLAALYIAALFSGFFSSRLNEGQIVLCGMLSTVFLFSILFIISRFLPSELRTANNKYIWLIRLCIPVVGIIGAMVGAFTPKRQIKPRIQKR